MIGIYAGLSELLSKLSSSPNPLEDVLVGVPKKPHLLRVGLLSLLSLSASKLVTVDPRDRTH